MSAAGQLSDDFGHWLAGFADGEGCFLITPSGRSKRNGTRSYQCSFRLVLRSDDGEILRECHRRTGLGVLRGPWRTSAPDHHGAQMGWNIRDKDGALELVKIFERFPLRAKKARDFEIWAQAVRIWQVYTQGRSMDWEAMRLLRDELQRGRKYDAGDHPPPSVKAPRDWIGERDEVIAQFWRDGMPGPAIAKAVNMPYSSMGARITAMRADGFDLPYRQGATSRHRGVSYRQDRGKWRATYAGRHIGLYETEAEASTATEAYHAALAGQGSATDAIWDARQAVREREVV